MHARRWLLALVLVVLAGALAAISPARTAEDGHARLVRVWRISYHAHDGLVRPAYVVLPRWYGPRRDPPLPLVISPHGRGCAGLSNAVSWGDLPARGPFALVSPEGQGRRLVRYSWGD